MEAVWTRYLPRLRRWARGRLPLRARDLVDTDDLVQRTVLDTLGRLGSFEPRWAGAFHAYLRQALLNRIRDEARRVSRRPAAESLEDELPDAGPSPLEMTVGRETLARYEAALEGLEPEEREAVVARVELGLSWPELAQALGRPSPDAARMTVTRALSRIARKLGADA